VGDGRQPERGERCVDVLRKVRVRRPEGELGGKVDGLADGQGAEKRVVLFDKRKEVLGRVGRRAVDG